VKGRRGEDKGRKGIYSCRKNWKAAKNSLLAPNGLSQNG